MKEQVKKIVAEAIEELNEQLDDDKKLSFDPEVRLIGRKAMIDSMSFVTLISIIEELVSDELDKDIEIVSAKAFSQERSPFYNIGTLIDFVTSLVEEA